MQALEHQQMIHCPYNFSHVILKHRMAAHLIKCRKQYHSKGFSTCPFNSTHDIPTPELQYHVEHCSDRRKLDSFLFTSEDSVKKENINDSYNIELPPSNENWDEEEVSSTSYLDVKNKLLENQPVFQVPIGLSKAEKRQFFGQQVKKFGDLSK